VADDAPANTAVQESYGDEDEDWEMVRYEETEEGRQATSISSGHFALKIGTKKWNKTVYSADWSTRTYEGQPTKDCQSFEKTTEPCHANDNVQGEQRGGCVKQ